MDSVDWPDRDGRGRLIYYFFVFVWLLYLAYPVGALIDHPPAADTLVASAAGLGLMVAAYVWGLIRIDRPPRQLAAAGAVILLVGTALTAAVGYDFAGIFIYAGAVLARVPGRTSVTGILVSAALPILLGVLARVASPVVVSVTLTTLAVGFATRWFRRMVELRGEVEYLARNEERVRIARDVHDILGHSLSVIILKAQLAARLVAADPERAAREMAEVEAVARSSLGEVRSSVAQAHFVALDAEIARVRDALHTAGIRCQVDWDAPRLAPPVETALSLVLREAVTNVLRHSGARTCAIRGRRRRRGFGLEVADDGRGLAGAGQGQGLRGIADRLRAVGGSLEVEGDGGTRLTAWVPAGEE